MGKQEGSRADWTMADAAVDAELFLIMFDDMTDGQKRDAIGELQDRLLEAIDNHDVRHDAEQRIERLALESEEGL